MNEYIVKTFRGMSVSAELECWLNSNPSYDLYSTNISINDNYSAVLAVMKLKDKTTTPILG